MRPILFGVLFGTFQPCCTAHSTTTHDGANATLPPSHTTPPCPLPPSPLIVDSLPSYRSLRTSNPAADDIRIAYPSPADTARARRLDSCHSNVTRCAPHHIFTLYVAAWVCHRQTSLFFIIILLQFVRSSPSCCPSPLPDRITSRRHLEYC